jgi:hypothetical protein
MTEEAIRERLGAEYVSPNTIFIFYDIDIHRQQGDSATRGGRLDRRALQHIHQEQHEE